MNKLASIGLVILLWCTPAMAELVECRQDAQTAIAVTIYNSNLGLIKDVRNLTLKTGVQEVKFMDVAGQINPVTVHVKSLKAPGELAVLEQNYEYDLLNAQKLLDKFVGKTVKLVDKNYYTGKEEIVAAELLSNNNGPIFRINNEIHINAPGRVILPEIPDNLIAQPTLVWMLNNKSKQPHQVEASYLTQGINWRADYIVLISDDNRKADLNGWVSIDNQSGATYRNATVKLVAGDINRVREEMPLRKASRVRAAESLAKDEQFQEESFFEYHLYTLERPSTIKDRQTKQIELLSAADIPIKERLTYYGADYYYRDRYDGQMQSPQKVGVFLDVVNKKEHNLGMPLPAGVIRAYKKDAGGSLQFIGEDRIVHTPKDEKITVKMGDAFDVVAERKQTAYKILTRNAAQRFDTEQSWEIIVRNHKDRPVEVEVVEPIPGDWNIEQSSQPFEKTEAHTVKFPLKIDKDKSATITYTVKIRYY